MLAPSGARIFFAGDTAYAPFFHDVRQRLGPVDLALLPIGAYEPPWFMQIVHMNPAEAVQAHRKGLRFVGAVREASEPETPNCRSLTSRRSQFCRFPT
jgi:hypothetical protein